MQETGPTAYMVKEMGDLDAGYHCGWLLLLLKGSKKDCMYRKIARVSLLSESYP